MKRLMWLGPLLLLAGCASSPTASTTQQPLAVDTDKVAADIRATDDQWRAACKARDAAKVASFWTDDAMMVASGMPSVSGKANLLSFVEGAFKDKNFTIDWTVDKLEVAASGDMAYEIVTETVTSTQGKKIITSHPIDTVIWKKQTDGSWKAVLDQSTDVPAAAPEKK